MEGTRQHSTEQLTPRGCQGGREWACKPGFPGNPQWPYLVYSHNCVIDLYEITLFSSLAKLVSLSPYVWTETGGHLASDLKRALWVPRMNVRQHRSRSSAPQTSQRDPLIVFDTRNTLVRLMLVSFKKTCIFLCIHDISRQAEKREGGPANMLWNESPGRNFKW